jgi:uncharacterized protein (TIGR03437 family)
MTYTPGVTQRLVVTISDPNQRRWGFQLAARLSNNAATQAGTFASSDNLTAVVCGASPTDPVPTFLDFGQTQTCPSGKPFTYIEHSARGSARTTTGSGTYEFDWTPPATDAGSVTIYVAGNAANGNGSNDGDRVYTRSYTLTPSAGTPGGTPPAISAGGVVSAAAYGAFTSIAPGTWVEIYGTNLSTTTREWRGDDFSGVDAPTALDGVRVTIGGQPAFVRFISPGQVNAQVASNAATGATTMSVTNANGTSAAYNVTVNPVQPGLLAPSSFNIGGRQYVVALGLDGSYILPPGAIAGINSRRARPGETVILYGIGFGPVATSSNANIPAGQIVSAANQLTNPMQLSIGGSPARLDYAGLGPNFVGLYQFNLQVPAIGANDAAPVTFTLGGAAGGQTLVMAVGQ